MPEPRPAPLWLLVLAGCAPSPCMEGFGRGADGNCHPLADSGDPGDSADTGPGDSGDPGDSAHTGETGHSGETGDTGDTGDSSDTGLPEGGLAPPDWLAEEAAHFTVGRDEGWEWERDEDWQIEDAAVPQVFVAPDGRYGMFLTNMDGSNDTAGRTVYWSEDGLDWAPGGVFLWPSDLGNECGTRLEDATLWHAEPSRWVLVVEGVFQDGEATGGEPRIFCALESRDGEAWSRVDEPTFRGETTEDRVSVPMILAREEGARLWYNGDLLGRAAGPGIRVADIDGVDHTVTVLSAGPMLDEMQVDPAPVYRAGGGVRLYHTWFADDEITSGIGAVELDPEGLAPAGEDRLLVPSRGSNCGKEREGECLMDPTFLALPDGTLLLYFTALETEGETWRPFVRRARSRSP